MVIVITIVTVGFGINGVLNMQMDYDETWFLDKNSYQTHYFEELQEQYPEQGERVEIYLGKFQKFLNFQR